MISFPRAPRVTPGQAIEASQFAGLAAAINARITSGLGNCTERIHAYLLGLLGRMRNPDETGALVPPVAEFFEAGYQQLTVDEGTWPVADAGDPEGANVSNLMMAYTFGVESIDFWDEATRLSDPTHGGVNLWYGGVWTPSAPYVGFAPPSTAWEYWQVKKSQIGAWDISTGGIGSPVLAAARSHGNLRASKLSPHGNSYGGYFATPEIQTWAPCDDPDGNADTAPPLNQLIFFSALREGLPLVSFAGTCVKFEGVDPANKYDLHVRDIVYDYQWMVYRIFLWNGTETVLSMFDYEEGPYTGAPRLERRFGGHLDRVLSRYIADFRGSAQSDHEEAGTKPAAWNIDAAKLQRFMTTPYLLAPQRGTESGGEVTPIYPRWSTTIGQAAGLIPYDGGGTSYTIHTGHVSTSIMVRGKSLTAGVSITILADTAVIGTLILTAGASDAVLVYPTGIAAGKIVTIRAYAAIAFSDPAGLVEAEITEQMIYKPSLSDWFLLLRLASAAE